MWIEDRHIRLVQFGDPLRALLLLKSTAPRAFTLVNISLNVQNHGYEIKKASLEFPKGATNSAVPTFKIGHQREI